MLEMNKIHCMDALEALKKLPDGCVDCVVTSPPYWGLRDYGVDGQIGLEGTPEAYVGKLVEVFREVRRVLRRDGTVWLNLGDTFYTGKGACNNPGGSSRSLGKHLKVARAHPIGRAGPNRMLRPDQAAVYGMKPKDICGIPWAVAFALRADGWYLRSEIIWSKPNPMPESVRDRPTRSHEYVFLLTKSRHYFYDAEAVKEAVTGNAHARGNGINPKARLIDPGVTSNRPRQNTGFSAAVTMPVERRNLRSVWNIATEPFRGAHFATFPTRLVECCIRGGTSEKGCCSACGAPWERKLQRNRRATRPARNNVDDPSGKANRDPRRHLTETRTLGWKPTCQCAGNQPMPCTVLDPFMGAGTTAVVAHRLRRAFIGFELNPEYVKMAEARLRPLISARGEGGNALRLCA